MKTKDMSITDAMKIIKDAIHADDEYAIGWQANIAMAMQDLGVSHEIANEGAGNFMQICFGRNTFDLV
jgi:hypothetical protein